MFAISVLFGMSYGSSHLVSANETALGDLLQRFASAEGEERILFGVRALCAACALCQRGDWSGLELFMEQAKKHDFPLLQAVALFVEASEPESGEPADVQKSWTKLVRSLKKFAPSGGIEELRKIGTKLSPLEHDAQLQDTRGVGRTDSAE